MIALVTGHDGFIGHHLTQELIRIGWEVHGLEHRTLTGEEPIDIRDGVAVAEVIAAVKPDVIYHLAGVSGSGVISKSPATVAEVNCTGTINLLEAASWAGAPRLVFSSSVSGYRKGPADVPTPSSVYGATKRFGEFAAQLYRDSGKLLTTTAVIGDVYGPGRKTSYPALDLVNAAVAGTSGVYDPPKQIDWLIHVRDCCMYLAALGSLNNPAAFYALVTDGATREQVAGLIERETHCLSLRPGSSEAVVWPIAFSIDKVASDTGLAPKVTLEAGIRELISMVRQGTMARPT